MKKHSIVALICALCLILSSFIVPASALAKGDADKDGKITASDARLVLRHSVKLEQLKGEALDVADVDGDGNITAADARLILRVSVKLESFCEHVIDKEALKKNILRCSKCGAEGADVLNGSTETMLEIFGASVNSLKKEENKYSNFSKTTSEFKEPEYSKTIFGTTDPVGLIFKGLFDKEFKNQVKKDTSYSDFTKQRLITNDNFPVPGKDFVSALKAEDIASYTAKTITGVDFIEELSDYKTANGKDIRLGKLKDSAKDGTFYKITINLKDEVFIAGQDEDKGSALDRIYMNGYNKQLSKMTDKQSWHEIKDKNGNDLLKMDVEITTKSKIVYYLNAEDLSPAAAEYDISMNLINQLNAYFNTNPLKPNDINPSKEPTGYMRLNIINDISDFYFFNDCFDTSDIK